MTKTQRNTFSTERQVSVIIGNGRGQVEWRDLKSSSLYLRVSANGDRKTWRYQYRLGGRGSRLIRINLGEWHRDPALGMSLEAARRTVLNHRKTISEGGVPQIEKTVERQRAEGITFGRLVERHNAEYLPQLKTKKQQQTARRLLDTYCVGPWGALPAASITRAMVDAVTKPIAKEQNDDGSFKRNKANRCFLTISRVFKWAIFMQEHPHNDAEIGAGGGIHKTPTTAPPNLGLTQSKHSSHMPGGAPVARQRSLTHDEIGKLLRRLRVHGRETRPSRLDPTKQVRDNWADDQLKCAQWLHLKLLTGARGGETRLMRWRDLALGVDNQWSWTIPAEHSKNGHAHTVPLSRQAVAILRELNLTRPTERSSVSCVFPQKRNPQKSVTDFGKSYRTFRTCAGLTEHGTADKVNPHDLRRAFVDQLGAMTRDDDETPRYTREFRGILLNHRTDARASSVTAKHYDTSDYYLAKRKALQVWADFLDTQILGVEPIARARRSA